MMTLAVVALIFALMLAWRTLDPEDKLLFAVAIIAYGLMGAALSIVLPLVAP